MQLPRLTNRLTCTITALVIRFPPVEKQYYNQYTDHDSLALHSDSNLWLGVEIASLWLRRKSKEDGDGLKSYHVPKNLSSHIRIVTWSWEASVYQLLSTAMELRGSVWLEVGPPLELSSSQSAVTGG